MPVSLLLTAVDHKLLVRSDAELSTWARAANSDLEAAAGERPELAGSGRHATARSGVTSGDCFRVRQQQAEVLAIDPKAKLLDCN
jgi:hypothetical protein